MELILIMLTSTFMGALFFACYQLGIKEGIKRQEIVNNKVNYDVEVKNQVQHDKIREYKKFTEYQGDY